MPVQILSILVVEDHPDTLEALGWFLEHLGHYYHLAPNAGVALTRSADEMFDAILTDVSLRGPIDGWELLRELAARGQLPVLVVSMSAGDDYIQAKRSKLAGCHAHLVKPFQSDELEAALDLHSQGVPRS